MDERWICGMDDCKRPVHDPDAVLREPHILHRCGLHEIASYNADELHSWGEDNAADMVDVARAQLAMEGRIASPSSPKLSQEER